MDWWEVEKADRGAYSREKSSNDDTIIKRLISVFSPVARQTQLLHHTLSSCSLSLTHTLSGRVVPLSQKMSNIPKIFIFKLQKERQWKRRRKGESNMVMKRRRRRRGERHGDEEEKEGKVRPLPLLLSAQTKDVSATIIQSQKRDEKQIQRGWQGTMKY